MIEALWSLEFLSNSDIYGAGVAVLESGKLYGGDSGYFYIGSYEVKSGDLRARVKVTKYQNNIDSIFGDLKEYNLDISGKFEEKEFMLSGHLVENPEQKIAIKLTHRADLP